MSDIAKKSLFFVVIFISNIIQCVTGFAGTVLATPFSLMLVGYNFAKPILNILAILASIWVLIFNYKSINWKEFIKIVLLMLPGLIGGFLIIKYVDIKKNILYIVLACLIYLFTFIGIFDAFIKKEEEHEESIFEKIILIIIVMISGLLHSMFVCGGPLLVIYASRKMKSVNEFRATLSLTWVFLNSIILVTDIVNGLFDTSILKEMLTTLGIAILVLFGALLVGNFIVKKINKKVFSIISCSLMGISATFLLLNGLGVM